MKKILIALAFATSTLVFAEDLMGGLVGGAIGGVIGNQFGGGNGKVATTIAGAALGAMIGSDNQPIYSSNSYSRVYINDYPTRVVYREIPQQVIYTQPRVIYVYANDDDDHRHEYKNHHRRGYARCDNDRRHREWRDED